jgi:hypothetical protein
MASPRSRFPFALLAAFALVLLLAVAVALTARQTLAERWLLAQLSARGVSPASLVVARLDLRGIEVRELVLGVPDEPDLAISSLEAEWSLAGLRARRLDAVRISAARLRGELGDRGLAVGALEPLFAGDGEPDGPLVLPAMELELTGGEVVLATTQGLASSTLAGQLRATSEGAIDGVFELRLEHPLVRANGRGVVSGTLAQLAAELALELRDGRAPARVAPARLSGKVSGATSALTFDLVLEGASGRLRAEARGQADVTARSGSANLRLAPLRFEPGGLQPAQLLPALEPMLERFGIANVAGEIEARGEVAVVAGEPKLSLVLGCRGLGFESEFVRVAGVAGTLALRAPALRSLKGQLVSVALLDPGLALTEGLLDFQLHPGGVLALRKTTWGWAGGELRAENLTLQLPLERTPVLLEAHGLDLAALLPLVAVEGLEGTGRIDGQMPLALSGSELRIENGFLRARPEGGILRFHPSEATRAYAESRPNDLGIAVAAFSDFRYEELEARIDGDVRGDLRIGLHVSGANPGFRSGHPIELNLNLDARLLDLVRAGAEIYRVPAVVEERLREFSQGDELSREEEKK